MPLTGKTNRALSLYRHQMSWAQVRLIEVRKQAAIRKCAHQDQEIVIATDAMAIQLRMALESIAYATLVTNESEYAAARPKGLGDWHAARILKAIAEVNPHFYPWPFTISVLQSGTHLQPADPSFCLTREEFAKAYDSLGAMLHAPNPLKGTSDYPNRAKQIEKWAMLTENLVSNHIVELPTVGFVIANIDRRTGSGHVRLAEPIFGQAYIHSR